MNYINVNTHILDMDDLCFSEKLVYALLTSYPKDNPFFGSDGYLAKQLNLSIGRIKNILTKLSKMNLIRRHRMKNERLIQVTQPVDNSVDNFTQDVTQRHTDVIQSDLHYNIYNKENIIHPAGVYNNTPSACFASEKEEEVTRTTSLQTVGLSCAKLFRTILERKKLDIPDNVQKEVIHYAEQNSKNSDSKKDMFKYMNIGLKLVKEGRWQTPFKLRQSEYTPNPTQEARQFVPEWTPEYKKQREQEVEALKCDETVSETVINAPENDGFHVASDVKVERKRPKELEELLEKARRW